MFSGEIIPGVEITTTYNGEVIEILGYDFDIPIMRDLLSKNVLTFEQKQLKEFELIKNRYTEIGVKFDVDNIKFDPKKQSCRISFCNEIKKYEENNKFFLFKESITSKAGFTRNEVYNPKSPLYVDESSLYPSLDKTLDMIYQSGGKSFLAHTYAYSKNISSKLLDILNEYDISGLECYYTTFTGEQSDYLLEVANKRKMYISGGSDYHGTNKVNHNLGTGNNNLNISEKIIENWHKSCKVM